MRTPKSPFTVHGGCSCGAIRYKVDFPAYKDRMLYPSLPASAKDDPNAIRVPFATTCHCNDCRSQTGSLVHASILAPASIVSVSSLSRESPQAKDAAAAYFDGKTFGDPSLFGSREATGKLTDPAKAEADAGRPAYRPSMEMLVPSEASKDSFINFYHPSEARTRGFCGRCGTALVYSIWPLPEGYPDFLSIMLATVDREDLERLEPETQMYWDLGVKWIKDMTRASPALKLADISVDRPLDQ